MSCTELYGLTKDSVLFIGETRNAWRGAMAVWTSLEKKYLPKYIPEWARSLGRVVDAGYSRTSDTKAINDIWKLFKSPQLTESERIVLGSTFDNVLAEVKSIDRVLKAFREFEGETSLKEQADLIEAAIKDHPEIIAIGWNQTSVNGNSWATENRDEESEEYIGYNLQTGTRHWFLIKEIDN